MVRPGSGIQTTMKVPQHPDKIRLTYSQWQQDSSKLQHNIQGLSPQPEKSVDQARFHYCVQTRECTNKDFSTSFGPYMDIDTGLQQGRYLNCANREAFQRGRLGVGSLIFPDQFSLHKNKLKTSSPLLQTLLDFQSMMTNQFVGLVEQKTKLRPKISDEECGKGLQVKRSLAVPNFGQTRMQHINQGRTPSVYRHPISSPFISCKPFTKEDGKSVPCTEEEIHAFILKRVAYYKSILKERGEKNHGHDPSNNDANISTVVNAALQDDSPKGSKVNAEPALQSKEDDCATSVSGEHLTENLQMNQKKTDQTCPRNKDETRTTVPGVMDELSEAQPISTTNCSPTLKEYKSLRLDINMIVDERDQVSGVSKALEHITESKLKVDTSKQTDVSKDFQTLSESEKRPFGAVSLTENQASNTVGSKGDQQRLRASHMEVISHSALNSRASQVQTDLTVCVSPSVGLRNRKSCDLLSEDTGSVCLHTNLNITLSEDKVKEPPCQCGGRCEKACPTKNLKNTNEDNSEAGEMSQQATKLRVAKAFSNMSLKNPEYEDISEDEEVSQQAAKDSQPTQTPCSHIQYENISEDENQTTEPHNGLSLCTNGGHGHVQVLAQINPDVNADEGLIQKKQDLLGTDSPHSSHPLESDNENLYDSSASSVHKDDYELHELCDDDDGNWIIIPVAMSDLRFEPESENQEPDDGGTEVTEKQCGIHQICQSSAQPLTTSSFSNIEVFETLDSFEQAKEVHIKYRFELETGWLLSDNEMDDEGEPYVPKKSGELYSDPEDSCDTDDSHDYPSGPDYNFLTGSTRWLKPPTAAGDAPVLDKEDEDDTVRNVQNGQTRCLTMISEKLRPLIEAKAASKPCNTSGENALKKNDLTPLDSSPLGEVDQHCRKNMEGNEAISSEYNGDSSERVDTECTEESLKNSLPAANLEAPKCKFEETMQGALVSHSTEKSLQQIESAAQSELVQQEIDRQKTNNKYIITLDSDSEDERNQNSQRKAKRVRFSSSESEKRQDFGIQSPSSGQMSETRLDSGHGQHKKEGQNLLMTESVIMISSDSDDSHGTCKNSSAESMPHSENGQQIQMNCCSEPSPPKICSQYKSDRKVSDGTGKVVREKHYVKRAANSKRAFLSDSEDDSQPSSTANKLPRKDRLLSEDLPNTQQQSDMEADPTFGPCPIIPQLKFKPQSPGKQTGNCKKKVPHSNSNKRNRSEWSKSTDVSTHGNVLNYVAKPKLVSRQSSLPHQTNTSDSHGFINFSSGEASSFNRSNQSRQSPISRDLSPSGEPYNSKYFQSTSNQRKDLSSLSTTLQPCNPARAKVTEDWKKSMPNLQGRRSRLGMKDYLNALNDESFRNGGPKPSPSSPSRDARPGPSHYDVTKKARPGPKPSERGNRQRHSSLEAAPLMRKTKSDYLQLLKAPHPHLQNEQRNSELKGYKWSEKPKPMKGSRRFGALL